MTTTTKGSKGAMWLNLVRQVINLSETDEWETAKEEWKSHRLREPHSYGKDVSCRCGKRHIVQLFTITNLLNGHVLEPIGSKCIQKFETQSMLDAVKLSNIGQKKVTEGDHFNRTFEWVYDHHPDYINRPAKCYETKNMRSLARYFDRVNQLESQGHYVVSDTEGSDEDEPEPESESEPEPLQEDDYTALLQSIAPVICQPVVSYVVQRARPTPTAEESNRKLTRGKYAGKSFREACDNVGYILYVRDNAKHSEFTALLAYYDRYRNPDTTETECML